MVVEKKNENTFVAPERNVNAGRTSDTQEFPTIHNYHMGSTSHSDYTKAKIVTEGYRGGNPASDHHRALSWGAGSEESLCKWLGHKKLSSNRVSRVTKGEEESCRYHVALLSCLVDSYGIEESGPPLLPDRVTCNIQGITASQRICGMVYCKWVYCNGLVKKAR